MKKFAVPFITFTLLFCSCSKKKAETNIDTFTFHSVILNKDMQVQVYLPPKYSDDTGYPVLYFFHDHGGSPYTVMEQYEIAQTAQLLIESDEIYPIIIAAVDIDRSFGINSSETSKTYETHSGKSFDMGMYEDYFMWEIIPYIDENYITDQNERYIGGYSIGGFAALYLALNYPESFTKAGGHSPSIFIDSFPDETVTQFLYPTDELREVRDPIRIVQNSIGEFPEFFLDVEAGGSDGVEFLYNAMVDKNITVQYHVLGLSHSRQTCASNMEEYLKFYAGSNDK